MLVGDSLHLVVYGKLHARTATSLGSLIEDLGTIGSKRVTVEVADRSILAPYARRWLQRRCERARVAALASRREQAPALEDLVALEHSPMSGTGLLQPSSGI